MIIRRAHTEDVKNIATLVMSLSHYYLPKQALAEELPKWFLNSLTEEQFLQRMNSNEYSNYVYCIDDEIVGYIAMKESSHLYHLFVSESHQGKGIANTLWQNVVKQNKVKKYTLRSSLYAVPVYKKWGFVETDIVRENDGIKFQAMALITK